MGETRILLPVKGGKIDDETLRLASKVVGHGHGSIVALYVIEVPREFPLDYELPEETQEAIEREADLILLGMHYKRRHGSFSMGQTVPYIMANAPCQVLVLRGAHPAEPVPAAHAPSSAGETVR